MLSFIPLHLSALEREPSLKEWVQDWARSMGHHLPLAFLSPNDWLEKGHDITGYFVNSEGISMPITIMVHGYGPLLQQLLYLLWRN